MPDAPIVNMQHLQRAKETTAGTLVTATRRVPADAGSVDLSAVTQGLIRRRFTGSLATSHSSSAGLQESGLAYEQHAFYDELALDFSTFLATPVITGAGADKTWTFTPSDTTDTLVRYSYEMGGTNWPSDEKFSGCVGNTMSITWNKTDDWMQSIDLMSMRNTQASKASLAFPATLVPIIGKTTRLYIDTATFGTTAFLRGISGEINIETGVTRRYGTDGNDYPNRIALIGPRVVGCSLVVEYDATTLRTAWRDRTVQKVRIENTGPVLGASNYKATIDINGTFDAAQIDEDDGVITLALEMVAEYDTTLGADIKAVVVCSLTAIP